MARHRRYRVCPKCGSRSYRRIYRELGWRYWRQCLDCMHEYRGPVSLLASLIALLAGGEVLYFAYLVRHDRSLYLSALGTGVFIIVCGLVALIRHFAARNRPRERRTSQAGDPFIQLTATFIRKR